jgi:hypothetical protein
MYEFIRKAERAVQPRKENTLISVGALALTDILAIVRTLVSSGKSNKASLPR